MASDVVVCRSSDWSRIAADCHEAIGRVGGVPRNSSTFPVSQLSIAPKPIQVHLEVTTIWWTIPLQS